MMAALLSDGLLSFWFVFSGEPQNDWDYWLLRDPYTVMCVIGLIR